MGHVLLGLLTAALPHPRLSYCRLLEVAVSHLTPAGFHHQPDAVFPEQPGEAGINILVLPVR